MLAGTIILVAVLAQSRPRNRAAKQQALIYIMKHIIAVLVLAITPHLVSAKEFHVSVSGNDTAKGSASKPFKTISAAARVAQPGDVITVHQGTYRERVNPPRGGTSDTKRIVYQAAPGEKVEIKGS